MQNLNHIPFSSFLINKLYLQYNLKVVFLTKLKKLIFTIYKLELQSITSSDRLEFVIRSLNGPKFFGID